MGLAVVCNVVIQDGNGNNASTKVRLPNGFTIAQYREAGQALAQVIGDMSTGQVVNVGIGLNLDFGSAGLKVSPLSLSDVYNKARYIFNAGTTGFRKILNLPAINDNAIVDGSQNIDSTLPDVQAFETAMLSGISTVDGTIAPVTNRGQDLTAVSTAIESFRRK